MMRFFRSFAGARVAAVIALLGFVVASAPAGAGDEKPIRSPFTPPRDGQANAHCVCVAATTGCSSKLLSSLIGDPDHDWWQTIHLTAGKDVDLGLACFRKRDVDGKGAGLCCELLLARDVEPDPADVNRLFGVVKIVYDQEESD